MGVLIPMEIAGYVASVIVTLISAFLLFFCRKIYKELGLGKEFRKEQERQKIRELIHEETQPIVNELEEIYHRVEGMEFDIENCERQERQDIAAIRVSYRFRLVSLCKSYIHKGYMTTGEYEQLSEFFRVYESIGGNGQAKEWYDRACELTIRDDEE